MLVRLLRCVAWVLLWCGALLPPAYAGVMTRASMVEAFPSPLIVGEKDTALPVWPIFKQDGTVTPIVAYVFESLDLAAIPGFSGTPFNLLIMLSPKGEFLDVRVLSQHEPVFLDGLGPEPMWRFVEQYKGLSLMQNIKIGSNLNAGNKAGSANVYIDGVAKATASVRILNQSLLAASLKVARAKLGYAQGHDPDLVARIRPEVYAPMDWAALLEAGLIQRTRLKNRDIEQAFAHTAVEGLDEAASHAPDERFTDLYVAYLDVPAVGRNLLSAKDWRYLQQLLEPGDHALLVLNQGRTPLFGSDYTRGSVPDSIKLRQQGLPLELRDLDLDRPLQLPPDLQGSDWLALRVIAPAGLDPSKPLDFDMHVTRSKGQIYPERVSRDFAFHATLPEAYYEASHPDNKTWHSIWQARWVELAVLVAALALLAWALRQQSWLAASQQRLTRFRTGYLLFTLGFIGWYAQGQLSIVNLTALVHAALAGQSLGFFLYDPMTVLLWAFVLVTLVIWGRGTFCGWLCPFGALQELVSTLARRLGLRPVRVSVRWDARLKRVKYAVLMVILAVACVSTPWTDKLVEVEPFKTSITLVFMRAWPFVLWAAGWVLASSVVYKGYCRYVCPLGAGMVLLGRLRLTNWLPRRAECGQPCQRCRHDCGYQAIEKSGAIDYDECFQCLDCVAILQDPARCVPELQARKAAPATGQLAGIPVVTAPAGDRS